MTGNKYSARADECFKVADLMADPQRKLAYHDLAQRWLRLATELDETDAKTQHDAPLVPLQAGNQAEQNQHPNHGSTPVPSITTNLQI
jgi:hypothetical protein